MALLTRFSVLIAATFLLAACGSGSGSNGGGNAPQSPGIPNDGKLHLKNSGVKKILLGRIVDLRDYLINSNDASYLVTEGQSAVQWVLPGVPQIKFVQGGAVTIAAADAESTVEIKFQVVFDSTGLSDDLPVEGTELPGSPMPGF